MATSECNRPVHFFFFKCLQNLFNSLPDHFALPLSLELLLSKMSFLFLLPFSKTHKQNILLFSGEKTACFKINQLLIFLQLLLFFSERPRNLPSSTCLQFCNFQSQPYRFFNSIICTSISIYVYTITQPHSIPLITLNSNTTFKLFIPATPIILLELVNDDHKTELQSLLSLASNTTS